MLPILLALASLAASPASAPPQPASMPGISQAISKPLRFERRRRLPRVDISSKPNGHYIPRVKGRRDRSLKCRGNRRKASR